MLLAWQQEGHPACKKLSGDKHVIQQNVQHLTFTSILFAALNNNK